MENPIENHMENHKVNHTLKRRVLVWVSHHLENGMKKKTQ